MGQLAQAQAAAAHSKAPPAHSAGPILLAWDDSWAALGRLGGALGWLLGGFGVAMGRLAKHSRRHLGAEAVLARISNDFCKIPEILGGHLGRLLTSKIDFFRDPRECPRRSRF